MAIEKKKHHVAVLSFPFGTHAAPLLSLVRKLASSASPDVSFSFFGTPKANAALPPPSALPPNIRIYDVADGVPEGYVFEGKPQEEIGLFLKATPGNFREALELAEREEEAPVSCLLGDLFLWFAGGLAEEMGGVPWVSFWTSSACSLSAHFNTDLIRRTIGTNPHEVSARLDEALAFVPGLSNFNVSDLPEGIVFGSLASNFSELLRRMAQESSRATAVVINTVEGLDPTPVLDHLRASFKKCLAVGPVSLLNPTRSDSESDPHSCIPWLDAVAGNAPASVAYVSFGTVMTPPPSELVALAEGLEASGAHFLWSLKDRHRETLPAGFLDRTCGRGLVVPWAPQSSVLAHVAVGAFVTHCGWNSIFESITGSGVPMICRPFFGDQRINGRMLSNACGIAVMVEGGALTRECVMDGLDLILRREEGKKMRELAQSLKLLALDAVTETGSSSNNLKTVLEIITQC